MEPTLHVGDIAVGDWTRASDLHVGEIITFPSTQLDDPSVTHRVRSITRTGSELQIETRGDANDDSEYWTAKPDELLGRKVARIPAVGGIVARAGRLRAVLAGVALALVLVAAVAARGVRKPRAVRLA
jgi:signal peptidase I